MVDVSEEAGFIGRVWESYREVLAEGYDEEAMIDLRRTFYAGFDAGLATIVQATQAMGEVRACRFMDRLCQELAAFKLAMKEGEA